MAKETAESVREKIRQAARELEQWADPEDTFGSTAPPIFPAIYAGRIAELALQYVEAAKAEAP